MLQITTGTPACLKEFTITVGIKESDKNEKISKHTEDLEDRTDQRS